GRAGAGRGREDAAQVAGAAPGGEGLVDTVVIGSASGGEDPADAVVVGSASGGADPADAVMVGSASGREVAAAPGGAGQASGGEEGAAADAAEVASAEETESGGRTGYDDLAGYDAMPAHGAGSGVPEEDAGPATLWTGGAPAVLQRVGIDVVDGRVRLEVDADRPVEPRLMFLPLPDRLVVDVPDAVLGAGWSTMPGDGDIVVQVRASATPDGGVRLVADLTGPT